MALFRVGGGCLCDTSSMQKNPPKPNDPTSSDPPEKSFHFFFIFSTAIESLHRELSKTEEFFCFSNLFRHEKIRVSHTIFGKKVCKRILPGF